MIKKLGRLTEVVDARDSFIAMLHLMCLSYAFVSVENLIYDLNLCPCPLFLIKKL